MARQVRHEQNDRLRVGQGLIAITARGGRIGSWARITYTQGQRKMRNLNYLEATQL